MLANVLSRARWLALAVLVASPSGALGADYSEHERQLYEAAKQEGEVNWYVAHYATDIANEVGKAFTERFPGVEVNVSRATGQVVFQRAMQDQRAGMTIADVLSSSDIGHYVYLKEQGLLEQYVPENADDAIEAYKGVDPDGYYHMTSGVTVLITYNTNNVSENEAPKNWTDLLDPKWKDQIALGHPAYSGSVGTWVVMMRKLYGWEFFEKLEENNPQIGRSINDTVTMLNAGERSIGVSSSATTMRNIQGGAPIGIIYPTDGAMVTINASGIMKGAPHPSAAKLFMEWLLSVENAEVVAPTFYEVMRPEVKTPAGVKSASEVKIISPSIEEITKGIPEVKELWRETFGI